MTPATQNLNETHNKEEHIDKNQDVTETELSPFIIEYMHYEQLYKKSKTKTKQKYYEKKITKLLSKYQGKFKELNSLMKNVDSKSEKNEDEEH